MTTKLKTRTRLPKIQRQQIILQAAKEVFSEKGYANSSIAEIAQKVGVVEPGIYKHYANKQELAESVLEEFYQGLIDEIEADIEAVHGAKNKLSFLIIRHIKNMSEPLTLGMLVNDLRFNEDYNRSRVKKLLGRYTSFTSNALKEGITEGVFSSDTPVEVVRDMIYGGIEHSILRHVSAKKNVNQEQLAAQFCERVFNSLLPNSGQPKETDQSQLSELNAITKKLGTLVNRLERGINKK